MATSVSLNAVETNFRQFIGVDHEYIFTESDAVSLVGFTLSFMLKTDKDDDDAAALLTITSAIVILGTQVTVPFADTDTSSLDAGVYYWELKRTDTGAETILGYGTLTLIRGVHHT